MVKYVKNTERKFWQIWKPKLIKINQMTYQMLDVFSPPTNDLPIGFMSFFRREKNPKWKWWKFWVEKYIASDNQKQISLDIVKGASFYCRSLNRE